MRGQEQGLLSFFDKEYGLNLDDLIAQIPKLLDSDCLPCFSRTETSIGYKHPDEHDPLP